jgi:hypothetical protein
VRANSPSDEPLGDLRAPRIFRRPLHFCVILTVRSAYRYSGG